MPKKVEEDEYGPKLVNTPPTLEEAQNWWRKNRGATVSAFACYYPGRYKEAADLARKVMKVEEEDDNSRTEG